MTPKEKAKELIKKHIDAQNGYNEREMFGTIAILSALIAVDEILHVCEFHRLSAEKDYWLEVKNEIESL